MRKRYNIGIIGYGTIGKVHERAINHLSGKFNLVAICDVNEFENTNDYLHFKNYKELINTKQIEVVSVATPPSSHYQISLNAINSQKHVLVEKPPTIETGQTKSLSRLSENNNLVFFTAYHMRYNPAVVYATEFLADKTVDKIEVEFKENVFNFHDKDGWIFDKAISGGGVLMDSGINVISVIKSILQDNFDYEIQNVDLKKSGGVGVETSAIVNFEFGKNGVGNIQMDWMYKKDDIRILKFISGNDHYAIDINKGAFLKNNKIIFQIEKGEDTMFSEYVGAYEHFYNCLKNSKKFSSFKELAFIQDIYKKSTSD